MYVQEAEIEIKLKYFVVVFVFSLQQQIYFIFINSIFNQTLWFKFNPRNSLIILKGLEIRLRLYHKPMFSLRDHYKKRF